MADRYEALLAEIRREFPRFRVVRKDRSAFQRAIDLALRVVTFGAQRSYLTTYQTTIGQTVYVLLPLPVGLAWFRARFEQEGYAETIRAAAEVYGRAWVLRPAFREHVIRQFTSGAYGWMWPFRRGLEAWYDTVVEGLPE